MMSQVLEPEARERREFQRSERLFPMSRHRR